MDELVGKEMSIPEALQVLASLERQWQGISRIRTLISAAAKLDRTLSHLARQLEAGVEALREAGVDASEMDAAIVSLREVMDALRRRSA